MTTHKTNPANPFIGFDMAKAMADFDPTRFVADFAKMAERYQVPGIDVNALLEAQRRNVEALSAANQTAVNGVRALAKQQSDIVEQTLDAARKSFDKIGKAGTPQEVAARHAEIAKEMFETAVANTHAVSELVAKSNADTADVIAGRIAEGLDEIKALSQKFAA